MHTYAHESPPPPHVQEYPIHTHTKTHNHTRTLLDTHLPILLSLAMPFCL